MRANPKARPVKEEQRIDPTSEHDMLHWSRRFRVTRQRLKAAVQMSGGLPSAVEAQLSGEAGAPQAPAGPRDV
jgi:hypothetical protein